MTHTFSPAAPWLSTVFHIAPFISMVIVHHWFFHAMLSENVTDIILTNKRLLYLARRLFVLNIMDEVLLHKIEKVEVRKRNIIQYLFNYGDLWIFTGGPQVIIPYVASPQAWAGQIERLLHIH
jgi:hypothetical protein